MALKSYRLKLKKGKKKMKQEKEKISFINYLMLAILLVPFCRGYCPDWNDIDL